MSERLAFQGKAIDKLDAAQKKADEHVRNYILEPHDLTDLHQRIDRLIKLMPLVAKVTFAGTKGNAAKRIIHICDWHLVSAADFRIDQEIARGDQLSDADADSLYREFVHDVAAVQIEQLALLKLFRRHEVKEVFSEGYAVGQEPEFKKLVESLPGFERQVNVVRSLLEQIREHKAEVLGDEAAPIEAQTIEMLLKARLELLRAGTAARSLSNGVIEQVHPLEDAGAMRAANPAMDGRIVRDPEKIRTRQEAMVKNVFDRGNLDVIILGASHDLASLIPPDAEYIRVIVSAHP